MSLYFVLQQLKGWKLCMKLYTLICTAVHSNQTV